MGNSGEIRQLEPEYQGRLGRRHSFCFVKFGSSRFSSETGELKQLEPGYPRRPGDPGGPIAPSSAGSATPPSSMNLASSVTGEIKQLEPEYPRRSGYPGSRIAPSSAGSATPLPSMNLASSKAGEIKQLQPEYPRWPVQRDRFYYLRFESCSFNSDTVELKQLEPEYPQRPGDPVPDCMIGDSPIAPSSAGSATPTSSMNLASSVTGKIKQLEPEYPRRPGDPVPDCTIGDSPIAPSSTGSATPPSSMYLASSKTGETKQLEPVYPQRPVQRDRFYYLRFDSSSFNSNTVEYPRRPGKPVPDCTTGDSPFAPSSAGSATPTSSMNLASSVTGKIKQLEPEYPRRAGEPVPDCMIGDSPFAPSSAGPATPPSSISVANSETGEIKQLELEYPRRPSEPDYTIGDSPIAFSSAGSAPPTSLMNLASSVSGEIKQLEPEYPRRPGKPDCPMSDASSLSSVNITTPPSENKRRIKKKSITAAMGDASSDVSAARLANSETGEKQPEPEYPLRPGKSDCSYYVKFGSCRYGKNCWFNHPLYMRGEFQRENWVGRNSRSRGSRASNSSEYNKQYFSDKACNYNRHEGKTKVKQMKLNFLGLPLRPGAILCLYYMNRGTCKFGTNCKFHHPDPESEDANLNASQHTTQGISQMDRSTKHAQQALNGHSIPLVTSPTIGTSEVIPIQGANLCPEWNGYQMDENKQGKSDWDPSTTKVFCDICTDEVLAGNRPTDHLNGIGYKNLCTKFNEKTKKGYNHEQFKSKWESLKKDYQTWKALMESEDDLGQGTKMNTISASLEWWAKKMEVMPDCEKFCFAPLENVNLLKIMFEDMVDLGSTTPGANSTVNTTIRSEQGASDRNDVGIIDKYVNEQSKEAMLQQSSKKEPNLTKLKTNYVHAELNDLVNFDENLNPRNLATSMRIDRVGSNIFEIMELVVGAGAEEGSDEHFIATQLFITPEHREMFLTLKTPRGRLGWLKKMCQV